MVLNAGYTRFAHAAGTTDTRIDNIIELPAEIDVIVPGKHRVNAIVREDRVELLPDGEEPGRDGLGERGAHLARILKQPPLGDIDVLEQEGSNGAVPGASEQRECDEGPVA